MPEKAKQAILALIILAIFVPAIQKFWPLIQVKPLKGEYTLAKEPHFTWKAFFDAQYQEEFEKALEDNGNLKPLFVRINNQIEFSLFNIPHAAAVVVGKQGYLYESQYIDSYLGRDFSGETYIDDQLRKLRFVQDELKKQGKDFLFVIAPGKGFFYPEYIPDRYEPEKRSITNYAYYIKRLKDLQINHVDFNRYFELIKDTSKYPLYPKCSIHWSTYGYTLAQDSLVRYVEKMRNIDLPDMVITGMDFPDTTRNTDYDIGEGLNLLWKIKFAQPAYPRVTFKNVKEKKHLKVFTAGDSFYNCFYYGGIFPNIFDQEGFWYYNKEIVFNNGSSNTEAAKENLEDKVRKNELLIFFVTERNLGRSSFNFIDNLYDMYAPVLKEERIAHYEEMIKNDPIWISACREEAKKQKIDLSAYIAAKAADYLYNEHNLYIKIRKDRIAFNASCIRNNSGLMSAVRTKARDRHISIDEMINTDAQWLYENEEAALSPKKRQLEETEREIRGSAALMEEERMKAEKKGVSVDEMVVIDAFWVYNKEKIKECTALRKIESEMRNNPRTMAYITEKARRFNLTIDEMVKRDVLYIYNEKQKDSKKF